MHETLQERLEMVEPTSTEAEQIRNALEEERIACCGYPDTEMIVSVHCERGKENDVAEKLGMTVRQSVVGRFEVIGSPCAIIKQKNKEITIISWRPLTDEK